MNNTKKMLEEFDERFNKPLRSDINKFINREGDIHTYLDLSDIKSFLASSIAEAEKKGYKRVVREIKEMAEPYDGAKWLNQIDPERLIKRLASLDTNPK